MRRIVVAILTVVLFCGLSRLQAQDSTQGPPKGGEGGSMKIKLASVYVDDIQTEFERLKKLDVKFTVEPTKMGSVMVAVLDDTCGNLIQIVQE